ncbi:hypothetical protein MUP77_15075 [Candidatus Bathyarchaeota archaeon]|nr:hypothetical protein [Candidatus Bathyarchaeota archaeon]
MLFKRKQVLCTNCGFFCWHVQHESGEGSVRFVEIGVRFRQEFQAANPRYKSVGADNEYSEEYRVYCLRRQWFLGQLDGRPEYVNADDIRKSRQCPYYITYQPAFGPEEHKELKREAETNRTVRNAVLLGAVIGAGAAIVAQVLYILLT